MSGTQKQILVVDDDKRLGNLLQEFLTGEGYGVDLAKTTEIARKLLETKAFNLVVVDVMMPGETGMEFVQALRQQNNPIPALMLTAMGEPDDRVKGLESGADDYLVKPFEPRELSLRIQKLISRNEGSDDKDVRFGDYMLDKKNGLLNLNNKPISLSSTELTLLTILAEHANYPISREELSQRLNSISERSVDVQVARLRKKLEPDPKKPIYLQAVRGQGYVLRVNS